MWCQVRQASLYFGERTVVEVEGGVRCRLWGRVWSTRTLRSPRHGDRRSIMWRGTVPLTILRTLLLTIGAGVRPPWDSAYHFTPCGDYRRE